MRTLQEVTGLSFEKKSRILFALLAGVLLFLGWYGGTATTAPAEDDPMIQYVEGRPYRILNDVTEIRMGESMMYLPEPVSILIPNPRWEGGGE